MEWISDEIMDGYHLVNRLVSNSIKKKYPSLKYFKITEESFNKLFSPDRENWGIPSLDVIICVDFSEDYSRDNSNIGIDVINLMFNSIQTLFTDSKLFERHSLILIDNFHVNKTEYCKGKIPHTVE